MKALLIDPEKRTIAEVQIDRANGLKEIYRLLDCKTIEATMIVRGSLSKGCDMLMGDDEGLWKEDLRYFHHIDGSAPIPGKSLVMGQDKDGASCDVSITTAELEPRVTYSQRKFRGTRTTEIPGGIRVDADLPIIDGTDE